MVTALEYFGVRGTGSKMPLAVALFAHAVSCPRPHRALVVPDPSDPARQLVHLPRGDLALKRALPRAEWEAAELLIQGHSYCEIADMQRISRRTVANQLASVFRKLAVSGRLELLRAIACPDALSQPATRRNPPGVFA
jgi:DNA-binding CsgD family transcriptional regulator